MRDETLRMFRGDRRQEPAHRLATIPPGYTTGRPTLIFDGETAATVKTYNVAQGLTLAPGDQVLVAMVRNGGVVICKIQR